MHYIDRQIKSHRKMLDGVEKAQPQHEKQQKIRDDLREIRRQLDRARELLTQSDKAIEHLGKKIRKRVWRFRRGFQRSFIRSKKGC